MLNSSANSRTNPGSGSGSGSDSLGSISDIQKLPRFKDLVDTIRKITNILVGSGYPLQQYFINSDNIERSSPLTIPPYYFLDNKTQIAYKKKATRLSEEPDDSEVFKPTKNTRKRGNCQYCNAILNLDFYGSVIAGQPSRAHAHAQAQSTSNQNTDNSKSLRSSNQNSHAQPQTQTRARSGIGTSANTSAGAVNRMNPARQYNTCGYVHCRCVDLPRCISCYTLLWIFEKCKPPVTTPIPSTG
jgi:hypothetical protein